MRRKRWPRIFSRSSTSKNIETALFAGNIARIEREDPRGPKFVIEGVAADNVTPVEVVGRFRGDLRYLIITVYEITPRVE
jgi:hypothetical protein